MRAQEPLRGGAVDKAWDWPYNDPAPDKAHGVISRVKRSKLLALFRAGIPERGTRGEASAEAHLLGRHHRGALSREAWAAGTPVECPTMATEEDGAHGHPER